MARVILVTGGARSGKSGYALKLAQGMPGPRVFLATCPRVDDEMRERIRWHRAARGAAWQTVEEETDIAGALAGLKNAGVVVVDCLTLWVNNLMERAAAEKREIGEEEVAALCREALETCRSLQGAVIFVTNEVGMGIVPDNPLARKFRDLAGRANQVIGEAAGEVALVACGVPLVLKKDLKGD